jgi:large subunit ribosomal protein L30
MAPVTRKVKITLVRSPIGCSWRQKQTVAGLGLRKLNHSVIQPANLQILGMARKVAHLVHIEEVPEEAGTP